MLLYSFACGVSIAGVAMILIVIALMALNANHTGSAFRVFKDDNRIAWGTLFLIVVGLGITWWGVTTVVTADYRPVDIFVTVVSAVGVLAITMVAHQTINGITQRKHH